MEKKINDLDRSTRLKNAIFYLLILINVFVVIILLQKRTDRQEVEYFPTEKAIATLFRTSDYQYRSEGLQVNLLDMTDSLFYQCLVFGHVLILRISDKHCDVCVSEALMDFEDFTKQNPHIKGIILASYDNYSDLFHIRSRYSNIHVMNVGRLNFPVDELSTPYLFLTNRTMLTDMVFVHQKEFPEKTKGYFEAIIERFNN